MNMSWINGGRLWNIIYYNMGYIFHQLDRYCSLAVSENGRFISPRKLSLFVISKINNNDKDNEDYHWVEWGTLFAVEPK